MTAVLEKLRLSREEVPLAAILLLALVLRLINLGSRNLWYDEAFAVLYAEKSFSAILYGTITPVEGAAADVHPLLYYFSLHLWMGLFGQSPFIVRLPSVIFGLVSIVLAFSIGRRLFDPGAGLLAAAITAIAPFHINYSQENRMYSLLCFLSLLTVYFFLRCWKGNGYGNWLGFILAATLSLYTHNLAFLVILALDLFVLLTKRWRLLKPLIVSHLAFGLLFSPWFAIVFSQFGKVRQAYWVPRPGLKELVQTLISFHFDLLPTMPLGLVSILLFLSLLILVLILYRVLRVRGRDRQAKEGIYLLLILALAPVVVAFLISQFQPIYIIRGLLSAAAAYYILVAKILAEAQLPKRVAWLLFSPVVVLLVISLAYHYTYAQFPRSPFDKAVAYLRENYQSGDAIVHDNKLTFFPCHYYDRELPQAFMADPPGEGSDTLALPTQEALGLLASRAMEEATGDSQRVWFVIFQRAFAEYEELGYPQPPHKAWLEAHFQQVAVERFNDLDVYLYEKRQN
jgi:4-amino-4-deoxy-L-arabinose transferase-like glycosyltransferase